MYTPGKVHIPFLILTSKPVKFTVKCTSQKRVCYSNLQRWFAYIFRFNKQYVRSAGCDGDARSSSNKSSRKVSVIFNKIHKILQYKNFVEIRSAFNGLSHTHRRTHRTISIHVLRDF